VTAATADSPSTEGNSRLDRHRARAWVVQILYRWESSGGGATLMRTLEETLDTRLVARRRRPYIRRILEALDDHLPEVDRLLEAALANWRLERLSAMDRAVLRLAATEILYLEDIPPRVSIQEAIRLAEQYGGPESPRFVNGVLDALFKRAGARE